MFKKLSHLLCNSELHLDVMYPGRIYLSSEIKKWCSENGRHYLQSYCYESIIERLLVLQPCSICLWCEAYPPSRSLALSLVEAISSFHAEIRIALADVCFNCIDEVLETAVYWEYRAHELAGTDINIFYLDEVPPSLNLLFSGVSVNSIVIPLTTSTVTVPLQGRITYAVNILDDISRQSILQEINNLYVEGSRVDLFQPLHINSLYQKCIDGFSGGLSSIDHLAAKLKGLVRLYMMHESVRRFSIMLRLMKHESIDILGREFYEMGYLSLPYSLSTHPEYFSHRILLDPGSHGIPSRFTQRSVEALLNMSLPIPLYNVSNIESIPYKSIKGIGADGVEIDILAQIRQSSIPLDLNIDLLNHFTRCHVAQVTVSTHGSLSKI